MTLSDKKILVGITGGIAAYKTCELIRSLIKLNAEVKAVITPAAKEFVTETTLRTLTQNPVYCEQFQIEDWKPEHVSLADSADLFVIAPASANTIGKIAHGLCDNLLTSLVAAFNKQVVIAPAMNCNMWENPAVQENIKILLNRGFNIIEPESGFLACGYEGKGRMADVQVITDKVVELLTEKPFLKGKKIIVTAGGTKEEIDPVRYIGNYSSGKMGIAIADAAYSYGADVTLITTVNVAKPYNVKNVKTACEMLEATKDSFINADSLIMAAAVADYRPKERNINKIKKENTENLVIELVKNPDILYEISKIKRANQTIIGFCAESENLIANATKKITSKNLDFIIANDISNPEIGFNSDYNEITIIDKQGKTEKIDKMSKKELAKVILKRIFSNESL